MTRTGGSTGAVSVPYATVNGTATAPGDFTAVSGTVAFADGETTKTVTVATTAELVSESAEGFTVVLSAPGGGATLGSPAICTVTITDVGVAPAGPAVGANPSSGGKRGCGLGSGFTLAVVGLAFVGRRRRG